MSQKARDRSDDTVQK